MGEPKKRDEEARYWRLRRWLELIKLGLWAGFQWIRGLFPFGPF